LRVGGAGVASAGRLRRKLPRWIAMTGVIGPTTPELLRAAHDRLGLRNMPVLSD